MAALSSFDTSPHRVYIENLMFTVSKQALVNTVSMHTGIANPQIRVIRKQEGQHRICSAIIGDLADANQMQHVIDSLNRIPPIYLAHILCPGCVSLHAKQAYLPGSRQVVRPPLQIPPQPKAFTPFTSQPSSYRPTQAPLQQAPPQPVPFNVFTPVLAPPSPSPFVSQPVPTSIFPPVPPPVFPPVPPPVIPEGQPPIAQSRSKHVPTPPSFPPPVQHSRPSSEPIADTHSVVYMSFKLHCHSTLCVMVWL